jgi:hypothetical protein
MDPDEALIVPVGTGTVLDEVQVDSIRKRQCIGVSIDPVQVEVTERLAVINLGPVTGNASDVVRLEDFLDMTYYAPTVDDGPGTDGTFRGVRDGFDVKQAGNVK